MNQYETVFILNPVLSEDQVKEAVDKFVGLMKEKGASIINKENWGLKKMAYPIQKKKSGFYHFVEFSARLNSTSNGAIASPGAENSTKW